jgi:hypothetical protein
MLPSVGLQFTSEGASMFAVSTYETDLAVLGREDFWLIVAFRGSKDETEIHSG